MIKEFKSKILEIKKITEDTSIFRLSIPRNFEFKAGQYVLLGFDIEGKRMNRAYSIASSPNKKEFIELCIKKVGHKRVSDKIHELKKGDEILVKGALGNFVIQNKKEDLFFIAAGTGIAVFRSMIPFLLETNFNKKITLLKSSRYEKTSLYDEYFSDLQRKHKNFTFHDIFSKPKDNNYQDKGHVQDFIEKYLQENFKRDFYICGLPEMVDEVKEKLESLGISKDRIFFEKY
ncbi:MAG: FAD-dependent oxidoreductase [Nanoarchaeota archaeon]|nr:FAD-dependent oxidoreductase [Nanoarchaeota archaeon]